MWRASSIDCVFRRGTPTGFDVLDEYLPGGGWPAAGIVELLCAHHGIGEFRLLAPALAQLSQTLTRWLLWVDPPCIPYAPALVNAGIDLSAVLIVKPKSRTDTLWVLEKALASQSCSAVLAWPRNLRDKEIRRLQVAGKDGNCLGVLFRPGRVARQSSPAELRILLRGIHPSPLTEHSGATLHILKRRGGWPTGEIDIEFEDRLNLITPDFSEMIVRRGRTPARQNTGSGYGQGMPHVNELELF